MVLHADTIARFLVTAFFAVVFLQSGLDKLFDRRGNIEFLTDHFKNSPFPPEFVPILLTAITWLELAAGGLCALGTVTLSFRRPGFGLAAAGVAVSGVVLLGLMVGQRLAKDYAGAAVITAYFAVVLLGLSFF